jgi:cysteine desulfurase
MSDDRAHAPLKDDLIYFDHAGTTPLLRPVLEAMWPFLTGTFGNPSSHHEIGRAAAAALDDARRRAAAVLGCRAAEITFTAGGTESINAALKGLAWGDPRDRHIVTSAIEHKAVLETCAALARHEGFEITVVPVDHAGLVDPEAVAAALRSGTTVCSVMHANNEVGTVEPIAAIARACRAAAVPFHTDAVQAPGLLHLDVATLGADVASLSAHKFGGPKGSGLLYARAGLPLAPLIDGGGQEGGRRSGTENVAAAVGLVTALEIAEQTRPHTVARVTALRDRLIAGVWAAVPGAVLTGHPTIRLPHHASFCFEGVFGETVLLELEMAGVCCSSGSACSAGSSDASHVLAAMRIPDDLARTAVRFTLGAENTEDEVDRVVGLVPEAVARVRAGSASRLA